MSRPKVMISAPKAVTELANQVIELQRDPAPWMFQAVGRPRDDGSRVSYFDSLFKAEKNSGVRSSRVVKEGLQNHPFDMEVAKSFINSNEHHATCIHTKVSCTVGLGFVLDSEEETSTPGVPGMKPIRRNEGRLASKADSVLNPLCEYSYQDILSAVCEDFWQTGNGYMEVVRETGSGKILGLHHAPSECVFVHADGTKGDFHFLVKNPEGYDDHFARFGRHDDFMEAMADSPLAGLNPDEEKRNDTYSDIIHFRLPTSRYRWYGSPDWLSAIAAIELTQCLTQYKYDFFLNRGVPEFMLFISGAKLPPDDWKKVEDSLKAHIGLGNSHKSLALNVPNPDVKVELHKLAMEAIGEDNFNSNKEANALSIVSAHRTPPLLAGILIPGKLGATNELPNALRAFQALVLGPAQRIFHLTMGTTLGSDGAGLGLQMADFELYTILDEVDINEMDTSARMRETEPEAKAKGRDLKAGVKK